MRQRPPPAPDARFPDAVFKASPDGCNEHLLVALHGLGDIPSNFITLATRMRLPQTAVIALPGPTRIPLFDDVGTGWFPAFDSKGDPVDPDSEAAGAGLAQTVRTLWSYLSKHVLRSDSCAAAAEDRWPPQNVFLLGYGQGGTCAIHLALAHREVTLGGVVSISGWPVGGMGNHKVAVDHQVKVLLLHGMKDEHLSMTDAYKRFLKLRNVIPRAGDLTVVVGVQRASSPSLSEPEFRSLMEFFGANLRLRNLKLEAMSDVYEL